MITLRSLPRIFRYLEWIYITAHFGMWNNSPGYSLPVVLGVYGIFFCLGWLYPSNRPYWQRFSYVVLGLTITVCARRIGIDLGFFLFFYIAKSYFLLNRRITILIAFLTGIIWTISEYLAEVERFQSVVQIASTALDPRDPVKFVIFTLVAYAAASVFMIMFCSMLIAEQKSRQRVEELGIQVESLAATLERTRIARDIHDSLGHTLTDLHIQLAVAQKLRFHNPDQAFQAVDTETQVFITYIQFLSGLTQQKGN